MVPFAFFVPLQVCRRCSSLRIICDMLDDELQGEMLVFRNEGRLRESTYDTWL